MSTKAITSKQGGTHCGVPPTHYSTNVPVTDTRTARSSSYTVYVLYYFALVIELVLEFLQLYVATFILRQTPSKSFHFFFIFNNEALLRITEMAASATCSPALSVFNKWTEQCLQSRERDANIRRGQCFPNPEWCTSVDESQTRILETWLDRRIHAWYGTGPSDK